MDLSQPIHLLRHLTFQLRHLFSLRIFARTAGLCMSRLLLVELPQRLEGRDWGVEVMLQAPVGNVGSSFHPQKLRGTLDMILIMLLGSICRGLIDKCMDSCRFLMENSSIWTHGFLGSVFNPVEKNQLYSQIGSYHLSRGANKSVKPPPRLWIWE